MMQAGIIFDVDGTLWDSSYDVARSWDIVFKRHDDIKADCTRDVIMSLMGKTMKEIVDLLLGDVLPEKRYAYARECEEYEIEYLWTHHPALFEGVKETIKTLSESYRLGIVSNCQSGYIEVMMSVSGIGEYISDFECFGNNGKGKGENIRLLAERSGMDCFYYVGDIQGDYDATMEAGGEFIHAEYGFGDVRDAKYRISSFDQLPGLLEEISPLHG